MRLSIRILSCLFVFALFICVGVCAQGTGVAGEITTPGTTTTQQGISPNDRNFTPDLYKVDFYRDDVAFISGGIAAGGSAGTANLLIRYRKDLASGNDSYMPTSFIPTGGRGALRTNSFGTGAVSNIMVSVSAYPDRLLRKNYPTLNRDTAYGFMVSRTADGNSGLRDQSYIYAFKNILTQIDADQQSFWLQDGSARPGINPVGTTAPISPQTRDFTNTRIRDVLAVDKDKAWAVGSVIKLFNGKQWFDFSNNPTTTAQILTGGSTVPAMATTANTPAPTTQSTNQNFQLTDFPATRGRTLPQFNALVGSFEDKADQDTVWVVGNNGLFAKITYTLSTDACNTATNTNANHCVENVKDIKFEFRPMTTVPPAPNSIGQGLPNENLTAISTAGKDVLYVTTEGGKVYKSVNAGQTFEKETIPNFTFNNQPFDPSTAGAEIPFNGVSFAGARYGFVAGNSAQGNQISIAYEYTCACPPTGTVAMGTTNNECSWRFRNIGGIAKGGVFPIFRSTSFVSPELGFLVGTNGTIVKLSPRFEISCRIINNRPQETPIAQAPYSYIFPESINVGTPRLPLVSLCSADIVRCANNNGNNMCGNCEPWNMFKGGGIIF